MSMTYHHWRHSFLLIENNDSHKQTQDPNFVENVIRDNKLNGKRIANASIFFLTFTHEIKF